MLNKTLRVENKYLNEWLNLIIGMVKFNILTSTYNDARSIVFTVD